MRRVAPAGLHLAGDLLLHLVVGVDDDRPRPGRDVDAGVEVVLARDARDARHLGEGERRALRAPAVGEREAAERMLAGGLVRHGERHPDAPLLAGEERAGPEDHGAARALERIAGGIDDATPSAGVDLDREAGGDRRPRRVELAREDVPEIVAAMCR